MFEDLDIWKLLAGLGIFMFGMFLMEESIKKLSGRAFKKLIRQYTTGKVKSIFSGIFVTSILQSSSAVSLMVLAFVGAGIMAMENAIMEAVKFLFYRMKLVVEPSGALGLAAILNRAVKAAGRVGIILSGGNIDAATMTTILNS